MKKIIFINISINAIIGIIFIGINIWALQKSLEESFIAFSIIFSLLFVIINALFFYVFTNNNTKIN
ncbi:MAG: hypothetical protein RBT30_01760 [Patescibacteria group bacterium]|jgi:hypothetical protein|nr:hypothetical protein [Patescibacteria group bacterium]MDX9778940.1 hypothetical protein [Patescibacteria group bacterium]